jgi:hypothetical protein
LIPSSARERINFISFCLVKYYSIKAETKIISYTFKWTFGSHADFSGAHTHISETVIITDLIHKVTV